MSILVLIYKFAMMNERKSVTLKKSIYFTDVLHQSKSGFEPAVTQAKFWTFKMFMTSSVCQ